MSDGLRPFEGQSLMQAPALADPHSAPGTPIRRRNMPSLSLRRLLAQDVTFNRGVCLS
jgi:hypothetical protein